MIRVEGLCLRAGSFKLMEINLEVDRGVYFVLLRPSGSGKSLFLEALCGLRRIERGRLFLAGGEVTLAEPRARSIGFVPQDLALFSHLTVRQNVAFGLQETGLDRKTIQAKTEKALDSLRIGNLAGRSIQGLSGGERQRVALARALAIEPKALLLDEPLRALDEQSRDATLNLLRDVHAALAMTTIHVCHDFAEMMAVAGRAGILWDGRLLQTGSPREILERPKNRGLARFVRSGPTFPASAQPTGSGCLLSGPGSLKIRSALPAEGPVFWTVRPERVGLRGRETSPDSHLNALPGTVIRKTDRGRFLELEIELQEGAVLPACLFPGQKEGDGLEAGAAVLAVFRPEDVHVMPE